MIIKKLLSFIIILNLSGVVHAQIGIGTSVPNPSAILDLSSTTKGFLIPRMTASQRQVLENPAIGLTIFNTTSGQIETNSGTVSGGILWKSNETGTTAIEGTNSSQLVTTQFVMANSNRHKSVNANSEVVTTSATDSTIAEMLISSTAGTYLISFNSEFTNVPTTIPSTSTTTLTSYASAQGIIDLNDSYNQIMSVPITNTTHTITFGCGETLFPGVYAVDAALSVAGVLTLDGGGNSNSVFIFRTTAAFNTGAGTSIVLKNGASASNIYWVSEGAAGLGAGTIMKGTVISHGGAVAMGAGGDLVGRLFTTGGAVAFGPGTAKVPTNPGFINFGILNSFVFFTALGALNGTGVSYITGNLGTNGGIVGGFALAIIDGSVFTQSSGTITTTVVTPTMIFPSSTATFSLYQNGILLTNSIRTKINSNYTSEISLQAIATLTNNEPIEVRWNVTTGKLKLANRILTLINVR